MKTETSPNHLIHSFQHSENSEGNMHGLTKREYFSGLAMKSFITSGKVVRETLLSKIKRLLGMEY
jgi:hypothetical protein